MWLSIYGSVYLIPARPYQCFPDTYDPFPVSAHVLPLLFEVIWIGAKLGIWQPLDRRDERNRNRWLGKMVYQAPPTPLLLSNTRSFTPFYPIPPLSKTHLPHLIIALMHHSSAQSAFTTALSMLLYNVSYLAYTHSVDVPLNQVGDVLSNLWTVCCSAELGQSVSSYPPLLSFLSFLSVLFLAVLCALVARSTM
ncbi:hypothetical protein BDZ97DRAFT_1923340 [Flammula alnicola]|nr:hypothetical protein BDZ97DRAFT_1923340 [Flammula alnicola]